MTTTTHSIISVEDLKAMTMADISELIKQTKIVCDKKIEEINVIRVNMETISNFINSCK
jgi:hypothetical protein